MNQDQDLGPAVIEDPSDDEASISSHDNPSVNDGGGRINVEYQDVEDDPLLEDLDDESESNDAIEKPFLEISDTTLLVTI